MKFLLFSLLFTEKKKKNLDFYSTKVTLCEKVSHLPCMATCLHIWFFPITVISPKAMLAGPTTYCFQRYHQDVRLRSSPVQG